jgi:HAD superfamily hydrolase (TIGR01490 family)
MTIAAFFDLDGTLISVNSAHLWMKRERRMGRITRSEMALAVFYILIYKIGFINMEKVTRRALQTVRGLEEDKVRQWTYEWFDAEVVPHLAPGGLAALEEHRAAGHRLVILTSASRYESEAALKYMNMDDLLCTRYEVVDGRFTGDVILPLCYGQGKVIHAERYAREHGVNLDESYFYTDSVTDLPMLLRVGNPRPVNPDPRLTMQARRRGWPILDWQLQPVDREPTP